MKRSRPSQASRTLLAAITFAWASTLPAQQGASLKGIVVDGEGNPVPFAYISADNGASTVSGVDGQFALRNAGTSRNLLISARRLGFAPTRQSILLDSGAFIRLALNPLPAGLPDVEVRAEPGGYDEYLDRSGFYRRVAKAVDGTFINREKIDKRNPSELSAMLTDVRSVRVEREYGKRGKSTYVLGRGGVCTMGLVVDGQRIEINSPSNESVQARIRSPLSRGTPSTQPRGGAGITESIDDIVPVNMIGAIEVYPNAAAVPNEFSHLTDACGLVVVWTRFRH